MNSQKYLFFTVILWAVAGIVQAAEIRPHNLQSGFGAAGFDVVSYQLEHKALPGKKEFQATFDGVAYLFSSSENLSAFQQAPQKYVPAYGGWCAYAMADGEEVEIDPQTFKVIDGKTYLFYNGFWGNTLKKWNKDEASLKAKADKVWSSRR
jgi:YHS domain-containing protein